MADPVTIGIGAMVVGGGISAISGYSSDMAQSDAEQANANYFSQQAIYSQAATERELDIFDNETDDLLGRQQSGYGKAGISLSGSPLLLMSQTRERAAYEVTAIKEKGRQNVELALMKARQAQESADSIASAAPWKAFGSLLGTAGSVLSKGAGASSTASTAAGTITKTAGNIPSNLTGGSAHYSVGAGMVP